MKTVSIKLFVTACFAVAGPIWAEINPNITVVPSTPGEMTFELRDSGITYWNDFVEIRKPVIVTNELIEGASRFPLYSDTDPNVLCELYAPSLGHDFLRFVQTSKTNLAEEHYKYIQGIGVINENNGVIIIPNGNNHGNRIPLALLHKNGMLDIGYHQVDTTVPEVSYKSSHIDTLTCTWVR